MHAFHSLAAVGALVLAGTAWAFQVTGPVLELTETKIVAQNG